MARQKKYNNSEELEEKINKYFNECDKLKKPYTLGGLALYLDIDRKTLLNYSKNEEYFHTIKKAKQRVECQLEESLYRLGNNTGVIFNLKNNFGWKDNMQEENNSNNGILGELILALNSHK